MSHSVFLLLVVSFLSPAVAWIPLPALAGVLLVTALRMVEVGSVRALLRAGRGEAAVLLGTAVATVALDLVTAVVLGVVAAGAVALRTMARAVTLEEEPVSEGDDDEERQALLDAHIVAYRLEGPLFFGGAHHTLLELSSLSDTRVVILRMSRVATLDATGAAVLRDTITALERRGTTVLLSGVRPEHDRALEALGVHASLADPKHLFASTPEAIAHARVHASRGEHPAEVSEPTPTGT